MNTLLSNMRLLGLPSSVGGRDFEELCLVIDRSRETLGYDLADESVYLFYSDDRSECRVGRSVIGPLKHTDGLQLWDWTVAPVLSETIEERSWPDLMSSLEDERFSDKAAIVRLVRRIANARLSLSAEILVHA